MPKQTMIRWSGFSLILAGVFMALGTLIHPSNESVQTILAEEGRLIAGHWLLTLYCGLFMLGLPGVYAAHSHELGSIGLVGFLLLFFGTLFYAVSSDYGFNAPVLARLAPQTLDAINSYSPVAIMDGLMILCMFTGFILFGLAIQRSHILPGWSGVMIAIGWPLFIIMGAISLMVFEPLWILAIVGSFIAGTGLAGCGYALWSVKAQGGLQPVEG